MPLVTTAAGDAVTHGWTDGLPNRPHWKSLAANTHTLLREDPPGHKTHQWRLSTSSHSSMSQLRKGQEVRHQHPNDVCPLWPFSLLFSFTPPSFSFSSPSFQNRLALLHYRFFPPFLSLPLLPSFVCFSSSFSWLPMTSFAPDYEEGERNIKWTKVWEHLHKMRHSSWKIV